MRRIRVAIAFVTLALAIGPVGGTSASADESTTVSIDASFEESKISVSGVVAWGPDATGDLTLGTDPSGDALVIGAGLDLAEIAVRPDIANRRLVWTLSTHDGLPGPADGPPPAFAGYQVPLVVDGQNSWRWLAAGTAGSGNPNASPQTGKWAGLCHSEVNGNEGGWSCPGPSGLFTNEGTYFYDGEITSDDVTWIQPFAEMKPGIQLGSIIEPGTIYCGAPCSFAWPPALVTAGIQPVDRIPLMDSYRVPGEFELGIASAGAPPAPEIFTGAATFNHQAGTFTGSLAAPAATGDYTVWARTCFGLADTPTCVLGSAEITV